MRPPKDERAWRGITEKQNNEYLEKKQKARDYIKKITNISKRGCDKIDLSNCGKFDKQNNKKK